ncbi:Fe-S cluster assembly protein SufD [Kitasatospora viridis]|uniref:Iron-regulated ABC transporter permease protein SufD n=1 Tax=Kitasatospora viridis TaxID=281105 RepID=A0A561UDG1_9ACTN|nr:Fe-S cluster assembly protein SufD [Kitasatospora viridis]TWF97412.1 iron-regulated ABC transporter permease protein SufD [Kitasatospora viridis]
MAEQNTSGSTTAGSIEVGTAGAGVQLAGPGTGRATVQQPIDARVAVKPSYDVNDFPVPTGREEDWRFTPLHRLGGLHDGTAVPAEQGSDKIDLALPDGVTAETVGRDDARIGKAGKPVDRVAAQAFSGFEQALVVTVPKDAVLTEPVKIDVHGEGGVRFAHVVIEVKPFAEAVVVLNHTGSGTRAANVELLVGDGAKLTFVSVQDWERDAVHAAQQTALIGRDASLKSVVVTFGGDLVRIHPRVTYAAPGGEAELFGLYFADAGQHLEHRLQIDHDTPHCRSNVVYKGALQGQDAHAVWVGDVLIRAAAEGTDTYEHNRNLVLTDGARVDSIPNLEIETGEIVGAGHASATGRFDDEQLFYLQARGIPEEEARRLVVRGFFAELVQQIGVPELHDQLMEKIEAELAGVA